MSLASVVSGTRPFRYLSSVPPTLSYDQLVRSLKQGNIAPVYYFHGEEIALRDDAVRAIVDRAVDPAVRDFNFDQRTASTLDEEQLLSLLNTLPMMAERRAVVLRDVESWQKKARARTALLRYLERPAPETVLMLVQGDPESKPDAEIAAHAVVVNCERLPPDRALRWIAHTAKTMGLEIPADAAEHLLHAVGNDLTALRAELEKLSALPRETPITPQLVGDLVGVRHGETVFDWREAVLEGDTPRAVILTPQVLAQSGVSGVRLVTLIGTTLAGLQVARTLHDKGTSGRSLEEQLFKVLLRARPFGLGDWKAEVRRWASWAPQWSAPRIRDALASALAADKALKNTTISDEEGIVMELVLRLGMGADAPERGLRRAVAAVALFLSLCVGIGAQTAAAQTSPVVIAALSLARDGHLDSARVAVNGLLTSTQPTDTLYPEILYAAALLAPSVVDARRDLQRVATEYALSPWADDALLRLGQLEFANGDYPAATRQLEKLNTDFPGSLAVAEASLWAARSYFALNDAATACRWLDTGRSMAGDNVERMNELAYYEPRCAAARRQVGKAASADSVAARSADSTTGAALNAARDSQPLAALPPSRPAAFSVQIVAAGTESAAKAALTRATQAGYKGAVVHDGAYWKVRLGSYPSRDAAAAAAKEIKTRLGGSPFVVAP